MKEMSRQQSISAWIPEKWQEMTCLCRSWANEQTDMIISAWPSEMAQTVVFTSCHKTEEEVQEAITYQCKGTKKKRQLQSCSLDLRS